ncbi:oxidoreductase [Solwaraspora sp. WMMD1047]|uniref:oxidoreductase n=1 Tax=Solwaraspora sp. WMMD1047 TaxID=3016102 RepID=UPI002415F5DB|nr:oxidoreductase [Solwaraspora sp. WMMD1047]MDG4830409.1 oxidoreductase [Solwaraspora sp. WMMD1047]
MTTFTPAQLPDLTGRTFVITGANSGIGRSAARAVAARGARVVLAVRDLAKGRAAAETMTGDLDVRRLDLADLASVRTFAERWTEPIDVLINNAGLMIPPLGRTADGFELQFGTNHLGHFALTNLLLSRIRGRVVTVSSGSHQVGRIDFDDPNWERRSYRPFAAYAQSKLANLLFTAELQRRLIGAGSAVLATAAHPGMAATNLLGHTENRRSVLTAVNRAFLSRFSQSEEAGALPTLYAAVADVPGGSYAGPDGFLQGRGAPKLVGRSRSARDDALARRLWTVSEQLTGVTFPLAVTTTANG